jgi:hypothetical protein
MLRFKYHYENNSNSIFDNYSYGVYVQYFFIRFRYSTDFKKNRYSKEEVT